MSESAPVKIAGSDSPVAVSDTNETLWFVVVSTLSGVCVDFVMIPMTSFFISRVVAF